MLNKITRVGVQVSANTTTRVARRYKSSNTSVVAERLTAVIKSVGQDPKAHKALIDKVEASKEFPSDTLVSASLFTKSIIKHVGETEAKYKDLIAAVEASPISQEIDFMDLSESNVDTTGLKTPEARFAKKVAVDSLRADAKRQSAFISDATEAILPVLDKHWGLPNGNVKPAFYNWWQKLSNSMAVSQGATGEPVRVAITGAAGSIGYALAFRVASGQMFGPTTPVILHLVELPGAMKALEGVVMEIKDCAFPLVQGIVPTSDLKQGFDTIDWALLVGSKPRSKGMERGDLLMENAKIFQAQGKAIGASAKRDCKVVVVGNPANTNALIAQANSGREGKYFSALTRLDHNRGLAQLADKIGCSVNDLNRFCIWGNHSATQYPDISHTTVKKDGKLELVREVINNQAWVQKEFIPRVQKRGAEIIGARGASSAASAASAVVDHVHDWIHGTRDWTSVAIPSTGEYGVTEGIVYSYPVICGPEGPQVVQDVPIDPFSAERMETTHKELISERDAVAKML